MMAHQVVQRKLLSYLVDMGAGLQLPQRPDNLLRQIIDKYPEVADVQTALDPGNVERALHELQGIAPHALRVERGELIGLNPPAIAEFQRQIAGPGANNNGGGPPGGPPGGGAAGGMGGGGSGGGSSAQGGGSGAQNGQSGGGSAANGSVNGGGGGGGPSASETSPSGPGSGGGGSAGGGAPAKKKRSATTVVDDDLAEVLDLVEKKSTKQHERQGEVDELLDLISKPSAKEANRTEQFRSSAVGAFKEFCRSGTKEDCARHNGTGVACENIHFQKIILPHTDTSLGDCSYLDTCRHMDKCKFVHYEVDAVDKERMREGIEDPSELDPFARTSSNRLGYDPFARHYESQFVNCDIRTFPMQVLGKFPVIMADPPWDIHMELPYGTMADDEMRRMNVQVLQDDGVMFLWVTGRAMELGRECLDIWGYRFVQELLWVKTNQLQRIIRTGRTGHWINHSKEHCLVGIKGHPDLNYNLDCDVVCAEVRARDEYVHTNDL